MAKDLIVATMEGCPPCRQLKQFLERNAMFVENFNVIYLDSVKDKEEIERLNVVGYPKCFIFENNKKISERSGFSERAFIKWINENE